MKKIFFILFVLGLCNSVYGNVWIEDNTIYHNLSGKGLITQTPHTLTKLTNYPIVNFTSYLASEQCFDFAFGFNTTQAKPVDVNLLHPHNISWNTSHEHIFNNVDLIINSNKPCEFGHEYNTHKRKIRYQIVTSYNNITNQSEYATKTSVVCFDSHVQNGNNYTISWQTKHSKTKKWKNIKNKFGVLHETHFAKNVWYYITDVTFQPNETKTIRPKISVIPKLGENSGKYDILIKRCSDTIAEAISSGHYIHLDPWWNSSYDRKRQIMNVSNTKMPQAINGTGGFYGEYIWIKPSECIGSSGEIDVYYKSANTSDYSIVCNDTIEISYFNEQGGINNNRYAPFSEFVFFYLLGQTSDMGLDATGNMNATVSGVTYAASGIVDGGGEWDGANDELQIADNALQTRTGYSFGAWANFDDNTLRDDALITKWASTDKEFVWQKRPAAAGDYMFFVNYYGSNSVICNIHTFPEWTPPQDTWVFLGLDWDSTNDAARFLANTSNVTGWFSCPNQDQRNSNQQVSIGENGANQDRDLDGTVDMIFMSKVMLSATEWSLLYNNSMNLNMQLGSEESAVNVTINTSGVRITTSGAFHNLTQLRDLDCSWIETCGVATALCNVSWYDDTVHNSNFDANNINCTNNTRCYTPTKVTSAYTAVGEVWNCTVICWSSGSTDTSSKTETIKKHYSPLIPAAGAAITTVIIAAFLLRRRRRR